MKTGILVALLGVLGVIIGGGMYAAAWHKTIGLGGLVIGVVLLIAGIALSMQKPKSAPAPMTTQGQTT
jgi:hypothetical protein